MGSRPKPAEVRARFFPARASGAVLVFGVGLTLPLAAGADRLAGAAGGGLARKGFGGPRTSGGLERGQARFIRRLVAERRIALIPS